MKSTREYILQTLPAPARDNDKRTGGYRGDQIPSLSDITSPACRSKGLVDAREERHGVGRPRTAYSLTRLHRTLSYPLPAFNLSPARPVKTSMPAPMVRELFAEMASEMAAEYTEQMQGLGMEERLEFAKVLLAEEGFNVEWEKVGDNYQIHEGACPYLRIGQSHPEVCTVDQTLISKILALPASKIQCILSGDTHCTYVVQPEPVLE